MSALRKITDPTATGNRLQSVRSLIGLNRHKFAEASNISIATLRSWESPIKGRHGLTAKGANRIVASLEQLGIYCTTEWLLHGTSTPPKFLYDDKELENKLGFMPSEYDDEVNLLQDVNNFKNNNDNAITLFITDRALLPSYNLEDAVGGIKIEDSKNWETLHGKPCIIETKEGLAWVRILQKTDKKTILVGAVLPGNNAAAIVFDLNKIAHIAPIIWHRKKL